MNKNKSETDEETKLALEADDAEGSSDLLNEEADEADNGSQRSAKQILRRELQEARDLHGRSPLSLFLSGLSAGLDLGFSLFLICVVRTLGEGHYSEATIALLAANMYAFGFVIVVVGRSELFTEQTSLAVLPVLNGHATLRDLARLWSIVYVANLIGSAGFAGLLCMISGNVELLDREVLAEVARHVVSPASGVVFVSALMAGWLMGLLSWLIAAGRDTISQIVIVWLVTAAIGLGGLHHSILGSTEMFCGLLLGEVAVTEVLRVLLLATIGNALGGSMFVAVLKNGQITDR